MKPYEDWLLERAEKMLDLLRLKHIEKTKDGITRQEFRKIGLRKLRRNTAAKAKRRCEAQDYDFARLVKKMD